MAKRPSRTELEAELKLIKQSRLGEGVILVLQNLIKWGAVVLIFKEIRLSLESFAGKQTLTDIGISFLSNLNVSITISWVGFIAGCVYGLQQRKLRKDTVERLQDRIKDLENLIDTNRSSSELTSRGDTRPEDRL